MNRDKEFIDSQITIKDNKVYTKEIAIIEFPKRYVDRKLAVMDEKIYVTGIFSIIIGNKYSVSLIPTYIETNPFYIKEIVRDEVEYIQFHYAKNSIIIENTTVIRNKVLTYTVFEELFLKANTPWFIGYEDLNRILENMGYYADSKIGENNLINEIITSYITRDLKNKKVYHRLAIDKPYTYVSLSDVFYSTIGTSAKLSGSFFSSGLVSALTQPEKSPTKLEEIIRR